MDAQIQEKALQEARMAIEEVKSEKQKQLEQKELTIDDLIADMATQILEESKGYIGEDITKAAKKKIRTKDKGGEQDGKKQKQNQLAELQNSIAENENGYGLLKKKTIKELIAPSGIDASNIDRLEIISTTTRFARTFFISALPRMATFPELLRDMYMFGDINTSIYINPIAESKSQNELNKVINELETERIVAYDKGNINRESLLAQKG